jgi:hypothetical protein
LKRTTTIATDDDVDVTGRDDNDDDNDDNAGDDASSTTSDEGNNCNRDNCKIATIAIVPTASTATTPAHRRRR